MKVRLEFKRQDLWIGMYWRKTKVNLPLHQLLRWDFWICVVPCFPLHIWFRDARWNKT